MTTRMRREIDEIPEAAARLASPPAQARLRAVADHLRELDPPVILTVARGSSDHAATYLKYAIEIALGRPVASVGPSVATVHGARLRSAGLAALAISQSGASQDLVALTNQLSDGGCLCIALTNTPRSPLAAALQEVIDIEAGPETAVAATKSFVNSVLAGLWIVAFWAGDDVLERALRALPAALSDSGDLAGMEALDTADRAVVIARGAGLGIAQEVALKLMETCGIHASGYSAAEVLHGPNALLGADYPVIALDPDSPGLRQAVDRLTRQGARVLPVAAGRGTGNALTDPLLLLPPLYRAIEALSRRKGLSPDAHAFLSKETRTL